VIQFYFIWNLRCIYDLSSHQLSHFYLQWIIRYQTDSYDACRFGTHLRICCGSVDRSATRLVRINTQTLLQNGVNSTQSTGWEASKDGFISAAWRSRARWWNRIAYWHNQWKPSLLKPPKAHRSQNHLNARCSNILHTPQAIAIRFSRLWTGKKLSKAAHSRRTTTCRTMRYSGLGRKFFANGIRRNGHQYDCSLSVVIFRSASKTAKSHN